MAQSRTGVYAAVAALGLGGYYLYRAGGDPKGATQEVKHDAHLARLNAPTGNQAEKAGEKAAYEARLNVDQAVDSARAEAKNQASRLDQIRQDTTAELKSGAEKIEHKVEEKAYEAKGALSGWFGKK
ncbi:hypothetical protein BP00DRAFT_409335 [Aspergillus indologenus CBS 114.80]|uniref:Calcofluor white hypersensitive protein n=1 Tax=Aspergillus indologenus CBS 114.80 TaxID=1450541 RepID=A0A2V5HM74_9EURO|nr:hypothetical protein BP00DRAFT_409335 [Aspergillus indologenus CBS 114.80]